MAGDRGAASPRSRSAGGSATAARDERRSNDRRSNDRRRSDRRQADRRQGDRRQLPRDDDEDSWFGALAGGARSTFLGERDAGLWADEEGEAATESRFLAREARRIVSTEGSALRRVFRAYLMARAVLGTALALTPWIMSVMGARLSLPMLAVCLGYAAQALSMWLLPGRGDVAAAAARPRLARRQWALTIGVDLLAFSTLYLIDPGAQLNFAALLALPVLMAGAMTKRLAALATAAFVTLVLLAGVWRSALGGQFTVALLTQAGLAGVGAFVITLLSGELAQRLAREERAARGSLALARQQARLNRLVIEEMADGVMVVDRRCRVRTANPAARAMLGVAANARTSSFTLHDDPAWATLLSAVELAYGLGHWPEALREISLPGTGGSARTVQVRARFTRRGGIDEDTTPPEDVCVLFLEDLRSVQARMRQEKLAAMGRVSAGIAHEIRNPLAAIAQANALMLEDPLPAPQQRLARIVEDNVERLKRIVDDVMAVAPGAESQQRVIDASTEVARIVAEWRATSGLGAADADRLDVRLPSERLPVLFDAEHLRRVLVNLLDNARRHGSETPGAVRLELLPRPKEGGALLAVASDGAPIAPEVEHHLFEPFFSTRSRGTGLGLYICRELCERHRASIEYRPGPPGDRHRNVFRVSMRGAPAAP
ncbi:PAS domain-containing protein [Aquincola sp. S2]|uniref:histidine kinase n=1 Tax=Pseudaquabacterium terrae TaxID=2732868 RepID=A0ABX2ECH7_9BURK|nr:ATP-binding protein [Aquabacterium terrae]NRF66668.1 PAS domain-containing protein [Aquabacterium terrae]